MIDFVYSRNLTKKRKLAHGMFTDRGKQFSGRHGWNVLVSDDGEQRDEYDALDPLYAIVSDEFGRHQGSMRFLPTTGRTMLNDHFTHVTRGVEIVCPLIWECTRFCVSEKANGTTSARLMAAGAKIMQELGIEHLVGVFDRRMELVYKSIGASPIIVGGCGTGRDAISVGLWEFEVSSYLELLRKSKLSEIDMELFLANSDIGSAIQEAEFALDSLVA